jgi:exodeoxyribonuclease V alpha subunit
VRLTHVFRQAQRSGVVTNAHRINAGYLPVTQGLADFFLFAADDPQQAADLVVDIVSNRLPRRFGLAYAFLVVAALTEGARHPAPQG